MIDIYDDKEVIYQSRKTIVYDNGGTVIKITNDQTETNLFHNQRLPIPTSFEYVANFLDGWILSRENYPVEITKEKIEESLEIQSNIVSLCQQWEWYAESSYSLFDHIEQYLSSKRKHSYEQEHAVTKVFQRVHKDFLPTLIQIISLVNELRYFKIYNIDWHPGNFGMKKGHLTLFELGGAKILE